MEDIDYDTPRNLNRNQLERLATLEFVRAGQDVFITGPTGTGKSTLAEDLAHRAQREWHAHILCQRAETHEQTQGSQGKGHIRCRHEED